MVCYMFHLQSFNIIFLFCTVQQRNNTMNNEILLLCYKDEKYEILNLHE